MNGQERDYRRWLDPVLQAAADPGAAATMTAVDDPTTDSGELVTFPGVTEPETPVLVAGVCGGAGTSVVAALAGLSGGPGAVCVDGTSTGTDLALRLTGGAGPDWQSWLSRRDGDDTLSGTDEGLLVLRRDRAAPDYSSPLPVVVQRLRTLGLRPIVDLGASVGSAWSKEVVDGVAAGRAGLVLVVPDRPDGANRARPVLSLIADQLGDDALARLVVVVTTQLPGLPGSVAGIVRDKLAGIVAATVHLDYDPYLARGTRLRWAECAPPTRWAASEVLSTAAGARP